ncbi:hypothetical protein SAMN02745866_01124 [Alteromonadaceae bacterium Bs31]|nr:hypothetical protein SAMN02745866_01124 [Alteromonadaceae bacterium Bs31]
MQNRQGELKKKNWYRSDRYFRTDNKWYFVTREKWNIGPFHSRDEAERGVLRYLKALKEQKTSTVARKVALMEDWDSLDYSP